MTGPVRELEGKVAIVTGAAGGIGQQTIRVLASHGAHVVAADLPGTALDALTESLRAEGIAASTHAVDISDEASVKTLIDDTLQTHGHLHILDNNATLHGVPEDLDVVSMPVDLWDRMMAVNSRGTMLMCKHAIPAMIAAGGGSIINISSGTSLAGDMQSTAYGASKAAINALTLYTATQYGAAGIRCNALALGLVATDKLKATLPPSILEVFEANKLVGHIGRPKEIAEVVAFLASDRSSYVTGQIWSVDGGFYAHVPTTAGVAAAMAQLEHHLQAGGKP